MKLVIQIPCYNEEDSLPETLRHLPRTVDGFDSVEWLIIDDGSIDNTVDVALANGVDHVVQLGQNKGLATAFSTGIQACLEAGADVIVNTDADNQYNANDIPKLVEPILAGKAEIVIGSRPIRDTDHFSATKKMLQLLGSWVVRKASGTTIADAPSGFRALSKEAALQLNVFDKYTYTLDTIIQAGRKNLAITSVEIGTNSDLRPSKLVKSIRSYVTRSMGTIFRTVLIYEPARVFGAIGLVFGLIGFGLLIRWIFLLNTVDPDKLVPSLVLASAFTIVSIQLCIFSMVASLLSTNRQLSEQLLYRIKSQSLALERDKK